MAWTCDNCKTRNFDWEENCAECGKEKPITNGMEKVGGE